MIEKSINIFWLLYGDRSIASSRLQGYLIHEFLLKNNINSKIIYSPPCLTLDLNLKLNEIDRFSKNIHNGIAIFQKLRGPTTLNLIQKLKKRKVATFYIVCDLEVDNTVPFECDLIICTSTELIKYYNDFDKKTFFIPDPFEGKIAKNEIRKLSSGSKIQFGWIGSKIHWNSLNQIREIINEQSFSNFELITISDHPSSNYKWKLNSFLNLINQIDVGIIPVDKNIYANKYKSNNRLTQFMAYGKPVLAGNIPSYKEIIVNGMNGFICNSIDEWKYSMSFVSNPKNYSIMSENAYHLAQSKFSIDIIGKKWVDLISGTSNLHGFEGTTKDEGFCFLDLFLQEKIILRYGRLLIGNKKIIYALYYSFFNSVVLIIKYLRNKLSKLIQIIKKTLLFLKFYE